MFASPHGCGLTELSGEQHLCRVQRLRGDSVPYSLDRCFSTRAGTHTDRPCSVSSQRSGSSHLRGTGHMPHGRVLLRTPHGQPSIVGGYAWCWSSLKPYRSAPMFVLLSNQSHHRTAFFLPACRLLVFSRRQPRRRSHSRDVVAHSLRHCDASNDTSTS
eukprot:TRINITY_DN7701_c0_g1_i1.p1 TRINITY_DN7701_c0_g1~~TRINITY_DN7701_c0_g1_i1.p1  ORF type:complete len:159 (-),score=32.04 TRINITY_DN7701_c0_g1_i1:541-1017(-)